MADVLIRLSPEQERIFEQLAQRDGLALREYLQNAVDAVVSPESAPAETVPPIWAVVEDIMRDVPPEELERVPADLSAQLDHYVYGTERREP